MASNYLKTKIRQHLLLSGSWAKESAIYLTLTTSAIDEDDDGNDLDEVSGLTRQGVGPGNSYWDALSSTDGVATNKNVITFGHATAG